jgi:hypothetical protein
MTEASDIPSQRVIHIGPDRVTITDAEVVIEAKYEMPEWEVRSSQTPAIYFEDKKYLLVDKAPLSGPYAFRYLLHPWPEGRASNPKMFFDYNAETVAERDADRRGAVADEGIRMLLLPLYPFLGLFWSGGQERLVRYGFIPRTLTSISIFTTFCGFFAQAVVISIMLNGSARSGKMMIGGVVTAFAGHNFVNLAGINFPLGVIDGLLLLALGADAAMRYTHYLREDQWFGGFLEWLLPKSSGKR